FGKFGVRGALCAIRIHSIITTTGRMSRGRSGPFVFFFLFSFICPMRRRPMLSRKKLSYVCLFVLGFCAGWIGLVKSRADLPPVAGRLRYEIPGGGSVFALSLRAEALPAPGAHDVVILLDTSASQSGAYREQGLKVLETCLGALSSRDRVR